MFNVGDPVVVWGEPGDVWDGTRGVIVRRQGAQKDRKPMIKLTHVAEGLNDCRLANQMRVLHVGQSYAFPPRIVHHDRLSDFENIEDSYEID